MVEVNIDADYRWISGSEQFELKGRIRGKELLCVIPREAIEDFFDMSDIKKEEETIKVFEENKDIIYGKCKKFLETAILDEGGKVLFTTTIFNSIN